MRRGPCIKLLLYYHTWDKETGRRAGGIGNAGHKFLSFSLLVLSSDLERTEDRSVEGVNDYCFIGVGEELESFRGPDKGADSGDGGFREDQKAVSVFLEAREPKLKLE